jgi:MFS family permease
MASPTKFQPYGNLKNSTYLGLLIAEFLAAFNDQCIHASAMFFAINTGALAPDTAITFMPILFYSPWAIFSTLAAYFADKYSKRYSLIFWKVAEVAITAFAFLGFWIGSTVDGGQDAGAYMVLTCVFLMGTHSSFYVPCKYGVLPEIFQPHVLSKANGFVESTSFLAVILGTVTGGILSYVFRGQEYKIGIFLMFSASVGTLTSLLIVKMPAANPNKQFPGWAPWKLYAPLVRDLREYFQSRPLALALTGIAFFTFMVAFMRTTMYMHGESQNPPWKEFEVSLVVAVVALGVGAGSPLAGYLSRGKVELGLVPLGALGMIFFAILASIAVYWHYTPGLVVTLAGIGFCAGFYIVPLYTLLQYRAPKDRKGTTVACSNFLNVTGAIIAAVAFGGLVFVLHKMGVAEEVPVESVMVGTLVEREPEKSIEILRVKIEGEKPEIHGIRDSLVQLALEVVHITRTIAVNDELLPLEKEEIRQQKPSIFAGKKQQSRVITLDSGVRVGMKVAVSKHTLTSRSTGKPLDYYELRRAEKPADEEFDDQNVPVYLFGCASLLTLLMLLLLCRRLPDFFVRSVLWVQAWGKMQTRLIGGKHIPTTEPALLATNCRHFLEALQVSAATDRTLRFLLHEAEVDQTTPLLRLLAKQSGMVVLHPGHESDDLDRARKAGEKSLAQGDLIAVTADDNAQFEELLKHFQATHAPIIVPVYYSPPIRLEGESQQRNRIVVGEPLPATATPTEIHAALEALRVWLEKQDPAKSVGPEASLLLGQMANKLPKG